MDTSHPSRTFIYGSCVSRDTFPFLGAGFELARYVARQSMISAGTDSRGLASQLTPIKSTFQQRMVDGDLAGNLPKSLDTLADQIDIVLVDLVDERGGVIEVGDSYVTKLSEFWTAGGQRATRGMEQLPFGTDRHFELWVAGAHRVIDQLKRLDLFRRTVVIRTPWADRYDDGEVLDIPGWMLNPRDADRLYGRYFGFLAECGLPIIELPEDLARTPRDHQWGASPFHYVPEAYEFLAGKISAFVHGDRPVLSRRNTSEWGEFVEFQSVEELSESADLSARATVWHGGFPIDLLIDDKASATTLVTLDGKGAPLPQFAGRALSAGIDVNRVFVADPSMLFADATADTWYVGTDDHDFFGSLVSVLETIQGKLHADHMVIHGAGPSGFGALLLSGGLPGSLALIINPATRLPNDLIEAGRVPSALSPRHEAQAGAVIYLQNSNRAQQVQDDLLPWLQENGGDQTHVLLESWPGDGGPSTAALRRWLAELPAVEGDWHALARSMGAVTNPGTEALLATID